MPSGSTAKPKNCDAGGELKNLKDTAKRTYGVNSLKELEEKAKQTNELVEKLNKEIDQDLEEIENLMKGTQ